MSANVLSRVRIRRIKILLVALTLSVAAFAVVFDRNSVSPAGGTASVPPVASESDVVTRTFRDGDGSPFSETDDTYIYNGAPDDNFGSESKLFVDGSGCIAAGTVCKTLIKFPWFIGADPAQVPPGSTIVSASLEMTILNKGLTQDVYQVAQSWDEATSTWNSLGQGKPTTWPREFTISPTTLGRFSINVTSIVQRWMESGMNDGILLASTHWDGVDYASSESSDPPALTVHFVPPPPSAYTIIDLGTLPDHTRSAARAINAAGQIVGWSGNDSETRSFLWEDSVMTDLGIEEDSWALDINDRGQIVGYRCDLPGESACRPFLWEDGVLSSIQALPDNDYNYATGINNRGQVAGWGYGYGSNAWIWENGTATDLGSLGGRYRPDGPTETVAMAINDAGQVVGRSLAPSDQGPRWHAFFWEAGVMTDLGTRPADQGSEAFGINAAAQIVGSSWEDADPKSAVLWESGTLTDLPSGGVAYGINDAGQVVGCSCLIEEGGFEGSDHRAFLWEDGNATGLGGFGRRDVAYAINDAGEVVGFSDTPNGTRAVLWASAAEPSPWTRVELGALPGDIESYAYAINDAGQIVGASCVEAATYQCHAFLLEDGAMRDLGTLGGEYSAAYGINDAGQVVGASTNASGSHHAFLWDDGVMTDLATLDGGGAQGCCFGAFDINDAGQVVGASLSDSGAIHAFLWEEGAMTDLGTLDGSSFSFAYGINERGQVVGRSGLHAFLWQDGIMTDLGTLGGNVSVAADINAAGQVVGYSTDASHEARSFLAQDGVMSDLGVSADEDEAIDRDINDAGVVAGTRYGTGAFVWEDGVLTDLGNGWAYGINDAGEVVGVSPDPRSAILWTRAPPARAPTSLLIEPTAPDPSVAWSSVALSAVLTQADSGTPIPDRMVAFQASEDGGATWWTGDGAHTDEAGRAKGEIIFTEPGDKLVRALFDGDARFTESQSANEPHRVIPRGSQTTTYWKGDGGAYSETDDSFIYSGAPDANYGSNAALLVDAADCIAVATICRTLVSFPAFIGPDAGQVPAGSTIVSATLELTVTNAGGTQQLFQVAEPWTESGVKWNSFATPGMPASKGSTLTFGAPLGTIAVNITGIVQNWVNGDANLGVFIWSTSANGADYRSSEAVDPPKLTVTFVPPDPGSMGGEPPELDGGSPDPSDVQPSVPAALPLPWRGRGTA